MTAKDSNDTKLSAAAEAYVWGFPLLSIHRTRLHLCSRTDTGTFKHNDDLATPADKAIVVPNNDTLYSSAWYDLTHGDLNIEVPPMDHADRYWNLMIVDAYGHTTYICRRHHGVEGKQVRVTLDSAKPPANDASRVATVSTPTAWVIVRVLVESPEDIPTARGLQHAFRVSASDTQPNIRTERAGRATAIAKSGPALFTEMKRYVEIDPPAPWHPQLSAEAQAILDNSESYPADVLEAGIAEGEKRITGRNLKGMLQRNGWSTGRDATGFGGDIVKRAAGAKFGLGGHQAIENRSYTALGDNSGQPLDGNRSLQLRFPADNLPPCSAFWSLTAYGTDMYLVENEIDRWSISDRTPGLQYADDGSLTIHFSAQRPANGANWLPVPNGPYLLGLRVYEGSDAVVNGDWFPPALQA